MKLLFILLLHFFSWHTFAQRYSVEQLYKAGIAFYKKGDAQRAAAIFEKIYAADSIETNALEFKTAIYGELKMYERAAAGFAKLSALFPKNDKYFSAACLYFTLNNQPKVAESFGKKAVALNKYRYNNMLNLAHAYFLQNEKEQSIYWYMLALQWVPSEQEFERAFIGDLNLIDSLKLMPSKIVQQYSTGLREELQAMNINGKATEYLDSVLSYLDKVLTTDEEEKILTWKNGFIESENGNYLLRSNVAANFGVDIGMNEYRKRNRAAAIGGYFNRVERIFINAGDSLSLAQFLLGISNEMLAYQQIENKSGKNIDALGYAISARNVIEKYALVELNAISLHYLANAYNQNDEWDNARNALLQLFNWSVDSNDYKGFFWATNDLSVYYSIQNKLDSALYFHTLCLRSIESAALTKEEAIKIKLNGLDLLYSSGYPEETLQRGYVLSVDLKANYQASYADFLELMGECHTALNNQDSAYYYYQTAVSTHISYSLAQEQAQAIMPVQISEVRSKSLWMLCNIAASRNNLADFFHWMEMMKDNNLRYLISQQYEPTYTTSFTSAKEILPEDAAALMYVGTGLVLSPSMAFSKTDGKVGWIDSKKVLQKLDEYGLQKTFATLLTLSQKNAQSLTDSIGSSRTLALMQFFYLSNVNPAASRSVINPKRSPVANNAASNEEKIRLSKFLYAIYVKPFESVIKGRKTLYISADLMQHFIPFESLIMDDGRYMAEVYDIIYTPSFTIHEYLGKRNYNTGSSIIAMGNPDYSTYHPALLQGRAFDFSFLGLKSWTDLPGTQQEIAMLQKSFDSVTVLSGAQLSETNLNKWSKEGLLNKAAILHFALHGLAGTTIAKEDNSLVVTEPDNGKEDGLLQFEEAYMLDIKPQLVCLSACETGLGMMDKDGSLANMGTAFLAAGAKAVLVTNWSISDEATAIFMKEVYNDVHANHFGFAQAVANTKRKFIRGIFGEQYKQPYFWAPFKYVGN